MNSDEFVAALNELCRVCLTKVDNMKPLLSFSGQTTLVSKLSALSNSVIVLIDKYPTCICNICEEKLNDSYEFQKLCYKSNHFLNECLAGKDFIVTVEDNLIDFNKTINLEVIPWEEENVISVNETQVQEDNVQGDSNAVIEANTNCLEITESIQIDPDDPQEEETDETSNEILLNFEPKLISTGTNNLQLDQYAVDDVEKIITMVKQMFLKHVNCVCCRFEAVNTRSLSTHMTRVHKQLKDSWCSACNKIVKNLKEHFEKKHGDQLKCPLCRTKSKNMGHFMEHLASHSVEKNHKCTVCKKSFVSKRRLLTHKMVHSKKGPFNCKYCNKKFVRPKVYRNHLKSHKKCANCDIICDSEESFYNHKCSKTIKDKNINHNTKNDIEEECGLQNFCKVCDKKVRSLPQHLKKFHMFQDLSGEYQNLCPHCGKQFKSASKLLVHTRIHTGENPYKCKYCDRKFKTRSILISHERTHTGEKPYVCKICGKGFAQSSVLNTHLKIHTGRPEECKLCSKRFCRQAELKLHMRQHTGEKPYLCKECNQAFKQRSHLVDHIKTHSEDRPFKCEYCEKAFKQVATLKSHLQIHLGQKPYKCTQCSYACRQPYSLTTHMLQHGIEKAEAKKYTCNVCHRSYTTVAHFVAHYNRYHGPLEVADISNALVSPKGEILELYDRQDILEDNKGIIIQEVELVTEESEN